MPSSPKPELEENDWEEFRRRDKARRAKRREKAPDWLKEMGVEFGSHNRGAHLILYPPNHPSINYWPGTGRWQVRPDGEIKRGKRELEKFLLKIIKK